MSPSSIVCVAGHEGGVRGLSEMGISDRLSLTDSATPRLQAVSDDMSLFILLEFVTVMLPADNMCIIMSYIHIYVICIYVCILLFFLNSVFIVFHFCAYFSSLDLSNIDVSLPFQLITPSSPCCCSPSVSSLWSIIPISTPPLADFNTSVGFLPSSVSFW